MQKSILIVDDFENSLTVTGFTLEQKGFKVYKAISAAKALQILHSGITPNLIITDYNMPVMNGLQLIIEIKKNPKFQRIPVLVLSTEIKDEVKKLAMKEGVTAWIQKPFQIEKLIEIVKRAIF